MEQVQSWILDYPQNSKSFSKDNLSEENDESQCQISSSIKIKKDLCELFLINGKASSSTNQNEQESSEQTDPHSSFHNTVEEISSETLKQKIQIQHQNQVQVPRQSEDIILIPVMKPPKGWRKDVIFKTILRRVRKEYLNEFNQNTGYIWDKRHKEDKFYLEKLTKYVQMLNVEKGSDLEQELIFFLGSIFYPKNMKSLYQSKRKQDEVESIHSSLYSFTRKKLGNLEKYASYHFLMKKFLQDKKNTLLSQKYLDPKETELLDDQSKADFILGFGLMYNRMSQSGRPSLQPNIIYQQ